MTVIRVINVGTLRADFLQIENDLSRGKVVMNL